MTEAESTDLQSTDVERSAEDPIFIFLRTDNSRVEFHTTVARAVRHLRKVHSGDDQFLEELICFDGLARPVEVRVSRRQFHLRVSSPMTTPWQVRRRTLKAVKEVQADVARGPDPVVLSSMEFDVELAVPKARVEQELREFYSSIKDDIGFCGFAARCARLCSRRLSDEVPDSWICCLLKRPCC